MNNAYSRPAYFGCDEFSKGWASIALFGALTSVFIAFGYEILRLGLDTPARLVPGCIAIFLAAFFGPLLLPARGFLAGASARAVVYPLVAVGVLMSVVLALWAGPSLLIVYSVLALAGLFRAVMLMRGGSLRVLILIVAASFGAAVYLFVLVHNQNYAGVYTPEQGVLGLLNHDTRFHAAIAYMVQNFHRPSLGLDGLVNLKYHFGSHYWFAGLGAMTGTAPLWSYGAGVPILAVPALLVSLLLAGFAIDHGRKPIGVYMAVGIGVLFLSDAIAEAPSYYISESYTFGLIGLLLFLPLMSKLANGDNSAKAMAFGYGLGVLAIPGLMSLKVSVGILWGVGLGWVVLRRHSISVTTAVIGVASLAALAVGLMAFAPATGDYVHTNGMQFQLFYYFRQFPEVKSFSSLVIPLCFVLVRLADLRARGVSGVRAAVIGKADLVLETVVVVTITGTVPPLLGIPQDSAVWYFFNVAQWYAMAFLVAGLQPSTFRDLWRPVAAQSLGKAVIAILAFVVLGQLVRSITPTFYKNVGEMMRTADSLSGGELLKGGTAGHYYLANLKSEHALFGHDFQAALSKSAGMRLIAEVDGLEPVAKPDVAVFIVPGNKEFWDFQPACFEKNNVQVSLTGRPSLLGSPPARYECTRDAYVSDYGPETQARALSDPDLCSHALSRKIQRVVVVNNLGSADGARLLDCR